MQPSQTVPSKPVPQLPSNTSESTSTELATKSAALPQPTKAVSAPAVVAGTGVVRTTAAALPKKISWREELSRLQSLQETDSRAKCYRALVYGASGTGKSTSLRTAKLPLLVHSFDPGGAKALSDLIVAGDAFVDTEFENEDPKDPKAFRAWDVKFAALRDSDIFSQVGTFVIDSATTWAQCALYEILRMAKRVGGVPQQNDWYPQMNLLELAIRQMLTLPCDVILIAHDAADKDEVTGRITRGPLFTGKLTKRIPILFDEMYYTVVKQTAKGPEYMWQTAADSTNEAKSRLAAMAKRRGQVIEQFVPQNFKELIKKAGLPAEDKKVDLCAE